MSGTRPGLLNGWRRLVARATARTLTTFVIPDTRMARNAGIDLATAGLQVVATPRHASLLLVIGELPPGLAEAATIVYAQMPRPRAILTLGADAPAPLPAADATASIDQAGLLEGIARIRNRLGQGAWSQNPQAFTASVLESADHDDADVMNHGGMEHGGHDRGSPDPHAGHHMPPPMDQHAAHASMAAVPPPDHQGNMHPKPESVADDHADTGPADHAASGYDAMECTGNPAPPNDAHSGAMGHSDRPRPEHGEMNHGSHASMDQTGMNHNNDAQGDLDDLDDLDEMDHGAMDNGDHAAMSHGGMDHSMMDGGFMSMIAMTQDLPRSRDGLPMEWIETSFGPLFPGLTAGLTPILTLDGDTVAAASLTSGVTHRDIAASLPGPVASFPDRLAALDPLAPIAYRVLAGRALEAISVTHATDVTDFGWIGACERERAASHLGWLAAFGELLGVGWLATRAAALHLALMRAPDTAAVMTLHPHIDRFLRDAGRIPMLDRRLAGVGALDSASAAATHGPVARGSGIATDARAGDAAYIARGFHPIVRSTGDALARLQVRLGEIGQSLSLVAASDSLTVTASPVSPQLTGTGMATIETPRGATTLHIEVHHGHVHMAHVEVPSMMHMALVQHVTEESELADALLSIASLDLSPWEIDQ